MSDWEVPDGAALLPGNTDRDELRDALTRAQHAKRSVSSSRDLGGQFHDALEDFLQRELRGQGHAGLEEHLRPVPLATVHRKDTLPPGPLAMRSENDVGDGEAGHHEEGDGQQYPRERATLGPPHRSL